MIERNDSLFPSFLSKFAYFLNIKCMLFGIRLLHDVINLHQLAGTHTHMYTIIHMQLLVTCGNGETHGYGMFQTEDHSKVRHVYKAQSFSVPVCLPNQANNAPTNLHALSKCQSGSETETGPGRKQSKRPLMITGVDRGKAAFEKRTLSFPQNK